MDTQAYFTRSGQTHDAAPIVTGVGPHWFAYSRPLYCFHCFFIVNL